MILMTNHYLSKMSKSKSKKKYKGVKITKF